MRVIVLQGSRKRPRRVQDRGTHPVRARLERTTHGQRSLNQLRRPGPVPRQTQGGRYVQSRL